MSDLERLAALNQEIARQQELLEKLTQEAAAIGHMVYCCCWHPEPCKSQELVRPGAGLPRGWLQKIDHCCGDATFFCPDHWDTACLDDTDYWSSGGESIRLPYGKNQWWDEGKWRRIKKKFGAR